ncbi:MAG TPA: cytochrome c biogenesis protein CcdA [Verrucomicrobiae bacterium]|nr:cytochrome c biogenesis protein CcdA [Verrucomicrobiae bacterium]
MRRAGAVAVLVGLAAAVWAAPLPEDVVRAKLTAGGGQVVVEATIAPGWHVNAHHPRDEFLIPTTVTLTPPAGVRAGEVQYPPPVEKRLGFSGGTTLLLYDGTVRFTATLEGAPAVGGEPLKAALRYQACDDSRCLPPRTLELVAALDAPAQPGAAEPPAGQNQVAGWIARWGWPLTFLWVALVGVALNLTPCVYPLISVTVAFFGGRTGAEESHTLRRALLYVLGICLTFSTLGVTAALTGSLFGAALQRPAVLAALALVLVGLAGSNFGFYQLRVPQPVMQRLGRLGEGDLGAFFMGLTMGVVAAPCIGPAVLALLLFVGARQSVALGFALFFVLGLGLGAPYLALAGLAGRLRVLPRAGAWLEWVERVFGFLLLGLALYFLAPLLPDVWLRATTVLLLVAAGVVLGFLGPTTPPVMRWPRRAGGIALVAFGLVGLLGAATESPIAWVPFSDDALARASAAGRPVLIDFEAAWCLPCREMDRTTFRDPAVARAAADFVMVKVDVTTEDERSSALTGRFGVAGVPTLVLLGPDGRERGRFARLVGAAEMARAMEEARRG